MPEVLFSFLIALGISILLHLALMKPGVWIGLVDIPQGRKAHRGAIPLIGGLAMFLAYSLSLTVIGLLNVNLAMLLAGGAILVFFGLLDDFFFLTPITKLFVQISVALMIILSTGSIISNLGLGWMLHDRGTSLLALGLTLSFLVGSMNAFNMMDGADGLAGGLALIAAGWLALAGILSGQTMEAVALMLLAAVVLGFLAFNARFAGRCQASVFMGDSGSVMLGCFLAAFAARLCGNGSDGVPFVALLWVFALPAIDAGSVIVRRIAAGGSPLRSDCRHIHLICRGEGWSVERTVGGLWLVSALLGGAGVLGWWAGVPDAILLIGLGVPVLLHVWFLRHSAQHSGIFLSRGSDMRLARKAGVREA
jgi:UDP-GlcNAc:undecaprenyl-phosphate/decaprenyl-phosphate GlcNAc-1-phosphate transferase